MKKSILAVCFLLLAQAADAKSTPPPAEPTEHPNWGQTANRGVEMLKTTLIDPGSTQVTWSSGFQWGYIKHIFGKRQFGWIACGSVNAKNRMGGYAGPEGFLVFVDPAGTITSNMQVEWLSTCDGGPFVAVQPELLGSAPPLQATTGSIGVADELAKLADLRDKRIITEEEFQIQKAKLLAR